MTDRPPITHAVYSRPMPPADKPAPAVRRAVRSVLQQSPAFKALPVEKRAAVTNDTVAVTSYMAGAAPPNVDFPPFVSGLVHGVFNSVVDASVQQMHAYAALMSTVAKTVDTADDTDESRRKVMRKVKRGMAARRL